MVNAGKFREDLFYRLNVVPIHIPPLRERKEDIPFLLVHYLDKCNKKYKLQVRLSKEVVERLCTRRWPGNIRELANLVEHLVIITNEPVLRPEHLPKKYLTPGDGEEDGPSEMASLREEVERYELKLIKQVVARSGTLEEAAHRLGVSLSTLTRRLRVIRNDGQ
jgi:transcriptional regulator with PAS, ATPase and Fis domain